MIQQLWRENPRANIGAPCGPNFWVLDIDPRHGGVEALAALEDAHGEIPVTLTAKTPSGGVHYYFRPTQDARNSAGKVGPGIDVRGHGGYVCVEGSRVNGAGYSFQDWDPLSDTTPELSIAPRWLTDLAFGRPKMQSIEAQVAGAVIEGNRNDFLTREAGRMRHIGLSPAAMDAALQKVNIERCFPPLEDAEVSAIAKSVGRYAAPSQAKDQPPSEDPKENILDWPELAKSSPPPFKWLIDHWLSWDATLLAGRGGVGKSLIAQQIATGLSTSRPLWSTSGAPVRVLCWFCEDDKDELWRRQDRICKSLQIGFDALAGLFIDARRGLENAIFATEFGRPCWTPVYGKLQQQVNDMDIDVLVLDNIAQTFGGNENDRHHVTSFVNGILGLVHGRPFCPIILGHVAKSQGSEFAGNMAWENSVRMRWYLAEKLPEQTSADSIDSETEASDTRFLCKRKTNYSANDYVAFDFNDGVFSPRDQQLTNEDGGTIAYLSSLRAKTIVLGATARLAALGIFCQAKKGTNYLPAKIAEMKLAEGFNKFELRTAMNALIMEKKLVITEVGRNSNRTSKLGLKVSEE